MRWRPEEVSQWLVVLNTKKVQAQLMCWPTNYHHLFGQGVRLVHSRENGQDRENGDKGINLVNIQSEEKYIQAG